MELIKRITELQDACQQAADIYGNDADVVIEATNLRKMLSAVLNTLDNTRFAGPRQTALVDAVEAALEALLGGND
jgi:hypothetical protein